MKISQLMRTYVALKIVTFLLLFTLANFSFGQSPAQTYERQNVRTFSSDPVKVAKLRNAVAALQSPHLDNATAWFNMAGIHEFADDEGSIPSPIKDLFHQCHRREALFFLWHRAYVLSMERLMQDSIHDPTFRIPYWDWYSDPSLPEIFRNEWLDAQHTQKNSLYVKDRNNGVNAGAPVWIPRVRTNYRNNDFTSFQNQLNRAEHGSIHMAVGNDSNMGDPSTAARDPIFWLHHVNIDRLLPVWLKIPTNHKANTDYPDWKEAEYRFPTAQWTLLQPVTATPTVTELALNSDEMLGYKYENTDPPAIPRASVPAQPRTVKSSSGGPLRMMGRNEAVASRSAVEISDGGTVKLAIKSDASAKFKALARPEEPEAPAAVTIVLSNVALTKLPPGVLSYDVFVNLPKAAKGSENFDEHYIGSISLFGLRGHHRHGEEVRPNEFRFDAKPALSATVKRTNVAPSEMAVSIVPVLAPKAKKPEETVLKIGEIRLETSGNSR